jgi:hypothetical protein
MSEKVDINNDNKNDNKNGISSPQVDGSQFTTVKKEAVHQTVINPKELSQKPDVALTASSESFLTDLIGKNTNRLPGEIDKPVTTPLKSGDTLKDVLDTGEVKFLSQMIIGVVTKLMSTALMFYSGDTKDSDYKIEKESTDRLTIILGKILEKNKVQMKMEFLFLIALSVAYAQPVNTALKNRKVIKDAKDKLKAIKDKPKVEELKVPKLDLPTISKNPKVIPFNPSIPKKDPAVFDEALSRGIAAKIKEGIKQFSDVELQQQSNFPDEIEKYIKELAKAEIIASNKSDDNFDKLAELSKEQIANQPEEVVVDIHEEKKLVAKAKRTSNPSIRRAKGGQNKG